MLLIFSLSELVRHLMSHYVLAGWVGLIFRVIFKAILNSQWLWYEIDLVILHESVTIWGNGFREMHSNNIILRFILFHPIGKKDAEENNSGTSSLNAVKFLSWFASVTSPLNTVMKETSRSILGWGRVLQCTMPLFGNRRITQRSTLVIKISLTNNHRY